MTATPHTATPAQKAGEWALDVLQWTLALVAVFAGAMAVVMAILQGGHA